jgi:ABC-type antimicrobial peptide transport system permease subunit
LIRPPQKAIAFLRWFCREDYIDEIEGDLSELFKKNYRKFPRGAKWLFALQVVSYFRPEFIKSFRNAQSINPYPMYKNYFKVGLRNLVRNLGYSTINIVGLASGMAVAMIIGLWVYDELSFNTYFGNYDRIAQITKAGQYQGKYYQGQKYLPYKLIEELQTNYAQNFKHVIPISGPGGFDAVLSIDDKKLTKTGMYIGEGAPAMFTFNMVYGRWSGLNDLRSILISESTSRALFGDADPLGRQLKINNDTDVTVTGVFKDFPKNTELFGLQFFQPWSFYLQDATWITQQGWDNNFLCAYVEIAENKTFEEVGDNIREAQMKVIRNLDYMKNDLQYEPEVLLHPMRDWHLYSNFKEGELQTGPVQMVWFIGTIGIFVLLLACINFMNLSTARSQKRAKEVGIRKTVGSVRSQLVAQFFSESFLIVILSFFIAIVAVALSLPWFNEVAGKDMRIPYQETMFWGSCLAFVAATGFLAGSYPALYLSSFKPVSVLKGVIRYGRLPAVSRKLLVTLQFSVSVFLIIFTASIYQQLMFVKERPAGYDKEGLIVVRKKSNVFDIKGDVLRAELKTTGVVHEVGESGGDITGTWSHNVGFNWEGKDPSFEASFATLNVSPEFGRTVGWKFIDGRDFSPEIVSDSAAIILNKAAVDYMQIKNPVGKTVRWTNRAWNVDQDFKIVGVIEDMIMNSPFEPVKPAIYLTYGYERILLIKILPAISAAEALPKIERVFAEVIPDIPFDYKFADREFAAKFSNEERIGKLAALFTTLAIAISCLGLFGLASFVAEQRTKEIGIRKVLGATVSNLWRMLSQEFVLLVFISCVIAIPLSYYILTKAISSYAYKTGLSIWIFVGAAVGALSIALATVSFQAVKAALRNPVKSIRTE